jgi:ATP-dependent Clp endopeptidase proteolytic subunit ClpP|tara:strand:+ start:436 stop:1077 length:642 start_codon:yes stop_codon:yes gene_type:complete
MIFEESKTKPEAEQKPQEQQMVLPNDLRILGLYGEVEEGKALHAISFLIDYSENSKVLVPKEGQEDKEDPELVELSLPVEFMISTPGGSADDMFAIYDIMRVAREKCDIITYGIGKVMSAGVLLLAAGTKGKRKIGKHCRVMIHSVVAGSAGSFHNLENEMSEIRHTQDSYIKALAKETKMTPSKIRRLVDKKVNIYLSAEEAVELGIADIIV